MGDVEVRLEKALGVQLRRVAGSRLDQVLRANFPITCGRVDWRRVKNLVECAAPAERAQGANRADGGFQTSMYVDVVIAFLDDCLRHASIADAWVGFASDTMLGTEYEVKLTAVHDLLREVAEVPDHKYVFGLDGSWCFMWSFEDDLYFGLRP